MAASEAGREVFYYPFSDKALADSLVSIHKLLVEKNVTVGMCFVLVLLICDSERCFSGDLYKALLGFRRESDLITYLATKFN